MRRALFRLLTVLLLGLALPVQGIASVTAHCGTLGHHDDNAAPETHAHAHDGAGSHGHADGDGTKQGEDGGNKPHCGASASIAGPAGLSIPSSPFNAKYALSQLPPLRIQPDGLDRPPLAL